MGMRVGVAALAAVAVWTVAAGSARAGCELKTYGEVPVTMVNRQPVVAVKINGVEKRFIADSGAFFSTMTRNAAQQLGLAIRDVPEGMMVIGIGGSLDVGATTANRVEVAGPAMKKVDFLVGGWMGPEIDGLIGQNLLGTSDVEYDLGSGVIRLFVSQGCGDAPLAYWAGSTPWSRLAISTTSVVEPHFTATAYLNGKPIRVTFDTGASRSILTLKAARKVGVVDAASLQEVETLAGRTRQVHSFVAPFDSFKIGNEEIRHAKLWVSDQDLLTGDMLLGADFFLSHRVYVSTRQHKLYFTYAGGRVFDLDRAPETSASASTAPVGPAATVASEAPKDADGWRRRGAALMSRNDAAAAAAAYTHAAELEPGDPRAFYERALSKLALKDAAGARADLDQALKLRPALADARVARAALRVAEKDEGGAREDLEAALKGAPDDPQAWLRIATLWAGLRDYEEATRLVDRWLAANPRALNRPNVLNASCWNRAQWGRELEHGRADCDAALKLRPGEPSYLDSRGLVRLRLGDPDGAIADYDEALRRRPTQAWSLYGRSLAKSKNGDKAGAEADRKAALALDPSLTEAARKAGLGS